MNAKNVSSSLCTYVLFVEQLAFLFTLSIFAQLALALSEKFFTLYLVISIIIFLVDANDMMMSMLHQKR